MPEKCGNVPGVCGKVAKKGADIIPKWVATFSPPQFGEPDTEEGMAACAPTLRTSSRLSTLDPRLSAGYGLMVRVISTPFPAPPIWKAGAVMQSIFGHRVSGIWGCGAFSVCCRVFYCFYACQSVGNRWLRGTVP